MYWQQNPEKLALVFLYTFAVHWYKNNLIMVEKLL